MKRFAVMQVLSGALYALAVTFGALMCPVTAFQIPVDPLPLFLTCAALCLLFAVLCGLRRAWFAICAAPLLLGALSPLGGVCKRVFRCGGESRCMFFCRLLAWAGAFPAGWNCDGGDSQRISGSSGSDPGIFVYIFTRTAAHAGALCCGGASVSGTLPVHSGNGTGGMGGAAADRCAGAGVLDAEHPQRKRQSRVPPERAACAAACGFDRAARPDLSAGGV